MQPEKDELGDIDPLMEERTMKANTLVLILLLFAAPLLSTPLAARNPDAWSQQKPHRPAPPAAAATDARDGGDTIMEAVEIAGLPYADSGLTTNAADDYDAVCPFEGSESPDVVYAYTPVSGGAIAIDLCGSDYDTKVFVYDIAMNVVACNDDFYPSGDQVCGAYASKIEYLEVQAGTTYYIIVDGYDGESGAYQLAVAPATAAGLECPAGLRVEGEPPPDAGGDDVFNGGCTTGGLHFQTITGGLDGMLEICQISGWNDSQAAYIYDVDWLEATVGPGGLFHCEFDADWTMDCRVFSADNCFFTQQLAYARGGRGVIGTIDLELTPGAVIWLYFAPASSSPPIDVTPYTFDYTLDVSGLEPAAAANEAMGWGAVKSLYK